MNKLNTLHHYNSNRSRRQFLTELGMSALSVGALASSLGGCSAKDSKPRELRMYGTGTLDIAKDWQETIKAINVSVKFTDNNNDTGPVIAQMLSGTAAEDYDMGGLQGGAEAELARAGTIIPWETEKIPNWEKVWPMVRNIPHTMFEGRQYGLPIVINADSMIYLPDKVGTITSYEAVFDPKLKGKTAMEDAWINSAIFTAIYLKQNNITKIQNPGNMSPDELGTVMEFLIKKKREGQFVKFWSGWKDGVDLIMTEQAYVMTGWEPIVYEAKRLGRKAEYATPREGYEGWSNDLILHKGARTRGLEDVAHTFANWELSGFYGAILAELRGYVVPNNAGIRFAQEKFVKERAEKIRGVVDHVQQKFSQGGALFWQNTRPTHYKLYEEWWSKLRSV